MLGQDIVMRVAEEIKNKYQRAWEHAHHHGDPETADFIILVCKKLNLLDSTVGCNGKRATDDLSWDAIWNDGRVVDIIIGAGGTNPTVGYNDVTSFGPGKFINPVPLRTAFPYNEGPTIPVPVPTSIPRKSREQFAAEFERVNAFYTSPEGLQRVGGMVSGVDASVFEVVRRISKGEITDALTIRNANSQVLNVKCDVQSMIAWGYDLMNGISVELVLAKIKASDEWKAKHPNG